jgi:hypothetical protein
LPASLRGSFMRVMVFVDTPSISAASVAVTHDGSG